MIGKLALALTTVTLGLLFAVPTAYANPAPSRERTESAREQTLQRIRTLLDNPVARERLEKMGLDRQDLEKRMEKLSDEDLQQLSQRLDSVGVGGDGVGLVIALLVIAALVLLIIFLAERT